MSQTYTRWSRASACAMWRQMKEENGVPCSRTTGSPSGSPRRSQRTSPDPLRYVLFSRQPPIGVLPAPPAPRPRSGSAASAGPHRCIAPRRPTPRTCDAVTRCRNAPPPASHTQDTRLAAVLEPDQRALHLVRCWAAPSPTSLVTTTGSRLTGVAEGAIENALRDAHRTGRPALPAPNAVAESADELTDALTGGLRLLFDALVHDGQHLLEQRGQDLLPPHTEAS